MITEKERCKDCGCFLGWDSCDTEYGDFSDLVCNNPKCPELKRQEQIDKLFEKDFGETYKENG